MLKLSGPHDAPKPKRPKGPRKFWLTLAGGGAVVLLLGVVFWQELLFLGFIGWMQRLRPIRTLMLRSDTAFHPTQPWRTEDIRAQSPPTYGKTRVLATRMANNNEKVFLLTWSLKTWKGPDSSLTRDREVYRYDPAAKRLEVAPNDHWDSSSTEILECNSWVNSSSPWRVSVQLNFSRLTVDKLPIPFTGSQLVGIAEATSHPWIAVVSAADDKAGFAWPGSGGSSAGAGQYYHQVFSLEDRTPVGPQVRLPSHTSELGESVPKVCWSADESHVIYAEPFKGMSIVAVDPEPRN